MKGLKLNIFRLFILVIFAAFNISCQGEELEEKEVSEKETEEVESPKPEDENENEEVDYNLPDIDLSNWKVTLPIGNPTEVEPPEILEYGTNETLKPFMYNDSVEGALVFYTFPQSSTANSSYSRTELREQMEPGSNSKNWTFAEGGRMKGTLAVTDISTNDEGKLDRVIIMQIHGRLTNAQRDQIGEDDNNAPPVLKIYWDKGRVRVKTKFLKDVNAEEPEILFTDAWGNDEGFNFDHEVGNEKFTLEIFASSGKMEIVLNEEESVIYEGIHMEKWGIFENYFKAGNYLVSTDPDAYSEVKYYDLEVWH